MSKKKVNKQVVKIVNNKTVHVELPGVVHKKLRAKLFLDELSMQKFFTLMAEKYVLEDSYVKSLVLEHADDVKNKKLDKLRNIDEKDLYDAIEKNSPFKN